MDRQKLIEDTIKVNTINKDGQVFDRGKWCLSKLNLFCLLELVSRVSAYGMVNRLDIELDINTEIYPMAVEENYKLVLASSVNADGSD